jgi:hypothetical protein
MRTTKSSAMSTSMSRASRTKVRAHSGRLHTYLSSHIGDCRAGPHPINDQ